MLVIEEIQLNQSKFECRECVVFLVLEAITSHYAESFLLTCFFKQRDHLHVHHRFSFKFALLKALNRFLFTTVQVGVQRIRTFYLSRGEGENHGFLGRIPRKGKDILIPYFGRVILFSLLN